jgi:hypothetical protein
LVAIKDRTVGVRRRQLRVLIMREVHYLGFAALGGVCSPLAPNTASTAGIVWPTRTAAHNPMQAQQRKPDSGRVLPLAAKAVVVVAVVAIKVLMATFMTISSGNHILSPMI